MADAIRSLQVGRATVSIISLGDLQADVKDMLRIPDADLPNYPPDLAQPMRLPIRIAHRPSKAENPLHKAP